MSEQFLTLHIPNQQVMLPSAQLVEVLSMNTIQLAPIPDTPAHVMGVTNWRGEVLWILDLSVLIGQEPLYRSLGRVNKFPVVIVIHEDITIGLAVVEVGRMIRCESEEIRSESPEMVKFGQGVWISPDRHPVLALSADKLLQIPTLEPTR